MNNEIKNTIDALAFEVEKDIVMISDRLGYPSKIKNNMIRDLKYILTKIADHDFNQDGLHIGFADNYQLIETIKEKSVVTINNLPSSFNQIIGLLKRLSEIEIMIREQDQRLK